MVERVLVGVVALFDFLFLHGHIDAPSQKKLFFYFIPLLNGLISTEKKYIQREKEGLLLFLFLFKKFSLPTYECVLFLLSFLRLL